MQVRESFANAVLRISLALSLRLLAGSLMILTGIIHLWLVPFLRVILVGPHDEWTAIMVLFGLLYLAIGIGLLAGKQISYYFGVIIPLVGAYIAALHEGYVAIVGQFAVYTYVYLRYRNPLIVIDIIVILCCCYLVCRYTSSFRLSELKRIVLRIWS